MGRSGSLDWSDYWLTDRCRVRGGGQSPENGCKPKAVSTHWTRLQSIAALLTHHVPEPFIQGHILGRVTISWYNVILTSTHTWGGRYVWNRMKPSLYAQHSISICRCHFSVSEWVSEWVSERVSECVCGCVSHVAASSLAAVNFFLVIHFRLLGYPSFLSSSFFFTPPALLCFHHFQIHLDSIAILLVFLSPFREKVAPPPSPSPPL